jgi:DNA helicase-2/ATP-dependent DNA helicase PcrA
MRKLDQGREAPEGKPLTKLSEGDRVIHDRFGAGKITALEGPPEDLKATVQFKNGGEKKLLLRFAKLRKL